MSLVQFFEIGVFKKYCMKLDFFKIVKKCFFEKVECLASTYKSGGLSCKLPKRTRYIHIYIYIYIYKR